MKLLNLFGDTIEISNLESIIKDKSGWVSINRSPKTVGEKFCYSKPIDSISILKLTEIIFEAEADYNNYLIEVFYDSEYNVKYKIEGTKF